MIGAAAALVAIDRAFEEPVHYTGAGLSDGGVDVAVIWSNVAAPTFQGAGATARTVSAEIRKELLPARPAKSDRITRAGVAWKPNEIVDLDDIGRWHIVLERA